MGTILTDSRNVHKTVLVIAVLYLSKLHLMRMIYDYGGYILDISGPVMIGVQKVTSVGFNLLDGMGRDEKDLTPEQKRYAIKRKPTPLEYFSYLFSFQTLMCGPLVYYNDYIDFISGDNIKRHVKKGQRLPSPTKVVIRKLSTSTFFAFMVLKFCPLVPVEKMADDDFISSSSYLNYALYMIICTTSARFKYFFAWILGETICNASGLGFAGYIQRNNSSSGKSGNDFKQMNGDNNVNEKKGVKHDDDKWSGDDESLVADWELASNVDIFRLETSLNFKILLDNWNKTTQSWLKRCAYDRTPNNIRTLATYILSAVWHGFYPGYYLCFLTGALVTTAAREGRRRIRPLFQSSSGLQTLYDVVTFCLTRLYLAYTVAPFVLLSLESSLKLYRKLLFIPHILCLFVIFIVPLLLKSSSPPPVRTSSIKSTQPDDHNNLKMQQTNGTQDFKKPSGDK